MSAEIPNVRVSFEEMTGPEPTIFITTEKHEAGYALIRVAYCQIDDHELMALFGVLATTMEEHMS